MAPLVINNLAGVSELQPIPENGLLKEHIFMLPTVNALQRSNQVFHLPS